MPSRRRLSLIFAAVILPLVSLSIYWAMQPVPDPGITLENFRRLRKGMTVAEVEAVIRITPKYRLPDTVIWQTPGVGDDIISVEFDSAGTVTQGLYHHHAEIDGEATLDGELLVEGTLEKLHRWVNDWTGW
jgi:hypothetical protein